jgi:hypothetical protein
MAKTIQNGTVCMWTRNPREQCGALATSSTFRLSSRSAITPANEARTRAGKVGTGGGLGDLEDDPRLRHRLHRRANERDLWPMKNPR